MKQCSVKIYLSDKAQTILWKELKDDLNNNWSKDVKYKNIWSSNNLDWDTNIPIIEEWEKFINEIYCYVEDKEKDISEDDWDLMIVSKDGEIYEELQEKHSVFSIGIEIK